MGSFGRLCFANDFVCLRLSHHFLHTRAYSRPLVQGRAWWRRIRLESLLLLKHVPVNIFFLGDSSCLWPVPTFYLSIPNIFPVQDSVCFLHRSCRLRPVGRKGCLVMFQSLTMNPDPQRVASICCKPRFLDHEIFKIFRELLLLRFCQFVVLMREIEF